MDQPGNFAAWVAGVDEVYVYSFNGSWFDIGDFKSLEEANNYYKQ